MKELKLYDEPIQALNQFENRGYAGMTDYELSFLCGTLKKFRPKKIVEVGVAAGGTTTVILNCLKLLDCTCEMYSVDICTQCYLDMSQKTGFIAQDYLRKEKLEIVTHKFMLGSTIADRIEAIGEGIDFVILDTMHALPGELLDFISIYTYLDKDAVIVFHDVGQSQLGIGHINGAPYEYASLITWSTIMGEKYRIYDKQKIAGLSNIGAVKLNEYTSSSIENLFLSLLINWNYIPDSKSLEQYRKRIKQEYDNNLYQIFEQAIECNEFSLYRRGELEVSLKSIKSELDEKIKSASKIYIYGAGKISKEITKYVEKELGRKIEGYLVTENNSEYKKNIYELRRIIQLENDTLIILGLDEKYHLDVLFEICQKELEKYVFPHNGVGFREMMKIIRYENSLLETDDMYTNLYGYEQRIRKTTRRKEAVNGK